MRVATIFDTANRPDTTGIYCQRALESLAEARHFEPAAFDAIPRQGFDLYLLIDDGLHYSVPEDLHPLAWWAIDTHLDKQAWYPRMAAQCDFVFAAQRNGVEYLGRTAQNAPEWLPLACDPAVHRKFDVAKVWDVAFVGNACGEDRIGLLELIKRHFPNSWIGRAFFEEMARIYSAARVVFNRSVRDDVNMRVFEALACGSLLVTNDLQGNGLAELFRPGVHLETYSSADELLDKLRYYLAHESARERIATAGHAEVIANHTYAHRMQALLRVVGRARTNTAVSKAGIGEHIAQLVTTEPRSANALVVLPINQRRRILHVGHGSGGNEGHQAMVRDKSRLDIKWFPEESNVEVVPCDWVTIIQDADHHATMDRTNGTIGSSQFDGIILDNALEGVSNPLKVLRALRSRLNDGGTIVACMPDVDSPDVAVDTPLQIRQDGCVTPNPNGQSRRQIEMLLFRAGFSCEVQGNPCRSLQTKAFNENDLMTESVAESQSLGADADWWLRIPIERIILRGKSLVPADCGLTSIVIVTHNELPYTKECLDSISRFTDEPHEIIIVDNASTDGTVEFIRELSNVTLKKNDRNAGFPAAANQGIRQSQGQQILLLNNDVVVTTGWLTSLIKALYSEPTVGLVGPSSNWVSGPQRVDVSYTNLQDLECFAWEFSKSYRNVRETTDRLVGFCLLFRREVIDRIGLLDEIFGIGNFEDDDICMRARAAGFKCLIARDSFVHHYGGRTFLGTGINYGELLAKNRRLFEEKWLSRTDSPTKTASDDAGTLTVRSPFMLRWPGNGGLLLELKVPQISLCMIVRDNAGTLPACLESIHPWVDEIIVVDTGSHDATPKIAASLGARVFHFPWCDDFAAARNESVRHARGQWIFWMDSDDTMPAENGPKLRELISSTVDPTVLGLVMKVHCPGPGDQGDLEVTAVDHVKLFRNLPELRFEGRIHEQVLPAIRRLGGRVAWTDVFVVHSGADQSSEGRRIKQDRDLRLLRLELRDNPDHPFVLFNLGMTFADMGQHERARDALRASIRVTSLQESHLRKAYALLVSSCTELEQFQEAWDVLQAGRNVFADDPELLFREGMLTHHFGRLEDAVAAYRRLLDEPYDRHFSSIDLGIVGFKARHNLALVYTDMGDLRSAEVEWRKVVKEVPRYRAGWRGILDVMLRQRRFDDALALTETLINDRILHATGLVLSGECALCMNNISEARRRFQSAVDANPPDCEAWNNLAQLLFVHGTPHESEKALLGLIRRAPEDAAAHHNLGTIYLRLKRPSDAAAAYRESLRLRADSACTLAHLGLALKDSGDLSGAVDCWRRAVAIDPADVIAGDHLRRFSRKSELLASIPG